MNGRLERHCGSISTAETHQSMYVRVKMGHCLFEIRVVLTIAGVIILDASASVEKRQTIKQEE